MCFFFCDRIVSVDNKLEPSFISEMAQKSLSALHSGDQIPARNHSNDRLRSPSPANLHPKGDAAAPGQKPLRKLVLKRPKVCVPDVDITPSKQKPLRKLALKRPNVALGVENGEDVKNEGLSSDINV